MLQTLKKLFSRSASKLVAGAQAPVLAKVPRAVADPNWVAPGTLGNGENSGPRVEMVHLSLVAILSRLPEDLRTTLLTMPEPDTVIALPLASVQKQLASGSVKMTLASLQRQSPAGTFAPSARGEDKRMVEVPLAEVFRTLNPQVLRRREDQRQSSLPPTGLQVFGDPDNPFALAPTEGSANGEDPVEEAVLPRFAGPAPSAQRSIRPPADVFATPTRGIKPAAAVAAVPDEAAASLFVSLASLAGAWPEPIRSEVLALNGAEVALPPAAVTAGLARGKVVFTWGQIRAWLSPAPTVPTTARESTELLLPLKVLAPVFLARSRPQAEARKKVELDDTIPALFNGGAAAPEAAPEAAPSEPIPAPPIPMAALPPPVVAPAPRPVSVPVAPAAEPVLQARKAQTLAEAFDQPGKERWSPPELVAGTMKLPGVAGAIIALQEGLVVAAQLPAPLMPETCAAFLPQMFARMAKYAGEMGLGEVQSLTLQVDGALFQTYRFGELYFGVMGSPRALLPLAELRLVGDQLAREHAQ